MSAARKALLALAGVLASSPCGAAPGDDPAPPAGPATVEDLARAVRALLDEARAPGKEFSEAAKLYARAREQVERWMNEHPAGKEPPGKDITDLAAQVERERGEFFRKEMPAVAYAWLRQKALELARDPKAVRQEAQLYFLRGGWRDFWNHMLRVTGDADVLDDLDRLATAAAENLTGADRERAIREAATVKGHQAELMDAWQHRSKSGGCTTSYGSGTFVVVPVDLKNRAVQAQTPTPDQWWDRATAEVRADWLLSICAEKGTNLLEVARAWNEDCGACSGKGSKDSALCPACNGSKVIRSVLWR